MRRTRWWLAATAVVLCAAACGRQSTSESAGSGGREVANSVASDAATAQRAVAPAAAGGESAAAPAADRRLVVNVSLDLVMADVQTGFERIGRIAEANGGLVADSTIRQEPGGERRATVTVRVPVDRYQEALAQIRGLAVKVDAERASANDVTEEYTDLESRRRNLEAAEQQLLVLLSQAKNVQEILTVQDRLTSTRAEIEKTKGRIVLLTRLTDLATIQAQLRPEPAPATKTDSGPQGALRRGWQSSLEVIGVAGLAAITVAAFSWWLLPVAALAAWLVRREQRRRAAGRRATEGA